jgi:hypothetical protein
MIGISANAELVRHTGIFYSFDLAMKNSGSWPECFLQ